MNTHAVRMLLGCLLPLLLVFVLPLLGITSGVTLFIVIILMFGCHLLIMGGHAHHGHTEYEKEVDRDSH